MEFRIKGKYYPYLSNIYYNFIQSFLQDLLFEARRSQEVTEEKLIEYTDTLLQIFDNNKDGKLQLSEMAQYV